MSFCKKLNTFQAGEGEFEEEEIGRALVAADFAERYRARFVAADFAAFVFVCLKGGKICQRCSPRFTALLWEHAWSRSASV